MSNTSKRGKNTEFAPEIPWVKTVKKKRKKTRKLEQYQ
jgi:hypothetical protein